MAFLLLPSWFCGLLAVFRVEPPHSTAPQEAPTAFQPSAEGGSFSVITVYSAEAGYRARAQGRPEEPDWGAGVFGDGLALLSEPSPGGSPLPTECGMEISSGHGPGTAPSP